MVWQTQSVFFIITRLCCNVRRGSMIIEGRTKCTARGGGTLRRLSLIWLVRERWEIASFTLLECCVLHFVFVTGYVTALCTRGKQIGDETVAHLGHNNVEAPPTAPWTEVVRLSNTHIHILSAIRSLVHQAFCLLGEWWLLRPRKREERKKKAYSAAYYRQASLIDDVFVFS